MKKVILYALICIPELFVHVHDLNAQSSLHDSLRHMVIYFCDSTRDDQLKNAANKVRSLYTGDIITDSLALKLLDIDSLLLTDQQFKQHIKISYTGLLVRLFQNIPPAREHLAYGTSLGNLAELYKNSLQFENALPLYLQCVAIYKKVLGETHPDYANSLNALSLLYQQMGQYDKALPLCEDALAIYKTLYGEKHPDYVITLFVMAQVYYYMVQYDKALPLSQKGLAIQKMVSGEVHPDYASALNNLAVLYKEMGQYDKAVSMCRQALAIYSEIAAKERDKALTLNNLALTYMEMGQYEKALPLFQQSLAIRKKVFGEKHPAYALSLNNIGSLYRRMGQYEKALPFFLQALSIRKETLGEAHPDYATSLNNIAVLYGSMGQYEKALPFYQEALMVRKKVFGEEHPDYANSLNGLGSLYMNSGNRKESAAVLMQGTDITLRYLNQTYASLSEQEKLSLLKSRASQFEYLPSLLATEKVKQPNLIKQVYGNELALKSMVLQDQQQVISSIRKSNDSTALKIYERWRFNKAFLGKQLLLPIAKRLPYLDSLQDLTNQLEQQLSQYNATFRNLTRNQAITAKDIAGKLTKGQAAIEFISFRLYNKKWTDSTLYAALVISAGDSNVHFVPLFEERQLQHLLMPSLSSTDNFAHYAAIQKLYGGMTKRGSGIKYDALYQLVWRPLEKYLSGIHAVYYAPAGLLHRIAFQALRQDATHLLIDKYQLKQVLSTRAVALPADIAPKPASVAFWGNITYTIPSSEMHQVPDTGLPEGIADTSISSFNVYVSDTRGLRNRDFVSLPETKKEIESLGRLFLQAGIPVRTDSGALATEEAFKALHGNNPQVLHLATHGFFLPVPESKSRRNDNQNNSGRAFTVQQNPMFRSGLVLAGGNHAWKGRVPLPGKEDGILTAYEIAQMDLAGTDLVVLSACETALGDLQGNEGVIGLQRAFKMAGVKQMMLSLWRVPDAETKELMTLFYRNWLGGYSTREALRKAQLKMKEKYPPFYWAAFVIVE